MKPYLRHICTRQLFPLGIIESTCTFASGNLYCILREGPHMEYTVNQDSGNVFGEMQVIRLLMEAGADASVLNRYD